ncbi:hypothetical protein ES703_94484 [subsurface metagenome]
MVVSVGNFTYADKKVGSSFSRYFEDELGAAIIRNPGFELFARDRAGYTRSYSPAFSQAMGFLPTQVPSYIFQT